MISKTQRNYRRKVRTWGLWHKSYAIEKHTEVVLRETWWFLWLIPLYSRELIEETDL
jgi:hypothetical protein